MFKRKVNLDKLQVNQPCSTDWEGMAGDDRSRFCGACNKKVYNLSAMTRGEIDGLVSETKGKFCARILKDRNGSVLTANQPIGLQLVHLRASKWASAVVTVALSLGNQVTAQSPVARNETQVIHADPLKNQDGTISNAQNRKPSFKGTVYDAAKAVIMDAQISLTNLKTGEEFKTKTSDQGTFQFGSLDSSLYRFQVEAQGFSRFQRKLFPIQATDEIRMDITLQVALMGEVVSVGEASSYQKFSDKILKPLRLIINSLRKFI